LITFKRRIGGKQLEIPLYDEEEAKNKGLHPISWRKAFGRVQIGDWVISDDGFCAEVIDVRANWIRTTAAWLGKSQIHRKIGDYGAFSAISRIRNKSYDFFLDLPRRMRILNNHRVQNALRYIAVHDLTKRKPDLEFAGKIAFPRDKKPLWGMRRIMAWKETQEMIKSIAKDILEQKNITDDIVMQIYLDALVIAKEKKDPSSMLKIADTLAEYRELKPKKVGMQLPPWGGGYGDEDPTTGEMLQAVQEAKAQLTAAGDENSNPLDVDENITPEVNDEYVKPSEYMSDLSKATSR
jgi:hypothetical protein